MRNKIYKISFILLFMLFVTGLFNFCFAYTATDITQYNFYTNDNELYTVSIGTLVNLEDLKITSDNIDSTYYNAYINYGYCYFLTSDGLLRCFIPSAEINGFYVDDDTILYSGNVPIGSIFQRDVNGVNGYEFQYSVSKNSWSKTDTTSNANKIGVNSSRIILACTVPFYTYTDDTYSSHTELFNLNKPSNEELTANCDFKVSFKFMPDDKDFPTDNVTSHIFYSYKCLITHTMSDWENYNVKFSIEKNVEGETWNNTYYDFYNINGDKLLSKKEILYSNTTLVDLIDLSKDNFIHIFSDNKFDIIKLKYYIYNSNNELLLTKTYTFKFTEDGLTVDSATGTILTEKIENSNGEEIKNNILFDTNGYDNTNSSSESDIYDVGSINSLSSSASDTIKLAKECFNILPGFIWAMVGIFLSVCIALRILGR